MYFTYIYVIVAVVVEVPCLCAFLIKLLLHFCSVPKTWEVQNCLIFESSKGAKSVERHSGVLKHHHLVLFFLTRLKYQCRIDNMNECRGTYFSI